MTGCGTESDRLQALSAGFDTHMTKPFDNGLVEELLGAPPLLTPPLKVAPRF